MNNYAAATNRAIVDQIVAKKLRNSMLWMAWGIFTTFIVATVTLMYSPWLEVAMRFYTPLLIVELVVVFLFSARAHSASMTSLRGMFFLYSVLNGLVFSVIAVATSPEALYNGLIGTLAFFVAFAVVGLVVKRDLAGLYPYLLAAVFAMIIVGLVQMFFSVGSGLSMAMGYLGVIVFAIFTAVDVNRIKRNLTAYAFSDEGVLERIELLGALSLYLDFVNLFLSFIRIFNRR